MVQQISYETYGKIRLSVAILLILYAGYCIVAFASGSFRIEGGKLPIATEAIFHVVFWTLVPPIFFFLEYYFIDQGKILNPNLKKDDFLKNIKTYQDMASKIWAAVLAAILFLIPKT